LKNGGAIKQQRFKVNGYNAEKWILISKKIQWVIALQSDREVRDFPI